VRDDAMGVSMSSGDNESGPDYQQNITVRPGGFGYGVV
jgi:hypothetical protein